MTFLTKYIIDYNMGDWASVLGLLATFVGFIVTIWNVWKSKTAAERAQIIVEKVRDDMKRVDTMAEFASAIESMEDIKRLHRLGAWDILLERYSSLKKQLLTVRGVSPDLNDFEKSRIQNAIHYVSSIEGKIEDHLPVEIKSDYVARWNRIINTQITNMNKIMIDMKNRLGEI